MRLHRPNQSTLKVAKILLLTLVLVIISITLEILIFYVFIKFVFPNPSINNKLDWLFRILIYFGVPLVELPLGILLLKIIKVPKISKSDILFTYLYLLLFLCICMTVYTAFTYIAGLKRIEFSIIPDFVIGLIGTIVDYFGRKKNSLPKKIKIALKNPNQIIKQ